MFNFDIAASRDEPRPRSGADGIIQPRLCNAVEDVPVDSVDGVIEKDEVIGPGAVENNYIITGQLRLQKPRNERNERVHSRDEIDSELIRVQEDEEEPSYSFSPSEMEEMDEASLGSDDDVVQPCCFIPRSSYLRKKCEELFFAVDYKPETVERILGQGE